MNRKSIATYAWGSLALAASLLGAAVPLHAADYKLIYGFQGGSDGQWPKGRLAQLGTDLFGATLTGGNPCNCGTIYRLTQSGQETVIHSFTGAPADGAAPEGGLAVLGTTLYGTTSAGGANQTCFNDTECGTVFRIEPNGSEKIIHNFQEGEAFSPNADITATGDAVWGTSPFGTGAGGTVPGGVFRTRPSGNTISFGLNGANVGYLPDGGLVKAQGAFYGTTSQGGIECGYEESCGSVFKMTTSGQFTGIYDFKGTDDGASPLDTLIYSHGLLYGTTAGGSLGTVFQLTLSGTETVLHLFAGGNDGASPLAGLTALRGVFYGTTSDGGGTGCGGYGCGTIFSITPTGTYSVIYSFQGGSDGQSPAAQMVVWNGALIGTTQYGGGGPCNTNGNNGCGTIFAIKP